MNLVQPESKLSGLCQPQQPLPSGATIDTCLAWAALASPVALAQLPTLLKHLWGISAPSLQLRLHPGGHFTVPWDPEQHPQVLRPRAGW